MPESCNKAANRRWLRPVGERRLAGTSVANPRSMAARIACVRICPGCRKCSLRAVAGGLGKMGACHGCGYTGPLWVELPEESDVTEYVYDESRPSA